MWQGCVVASVILTFGLIAHSLALLTQSPWPYFAAAGLVIPAILALVIGWVDLRKMWLVGLLKPSQGPPEGKE